MAGIGLSICIVRHVAEKWTTLLENDENNDNGSMLGGYNRTRSIYMQFWLFYTNVSVWQTEWRQHDVARHPTDTILEGKGMMNLAIGMYHERTWRVLRQNHAQ